MRMWRRKLHKPGEYEPLPPEEQPMHWFVERKGIPMIDRIGWLLLGVMIGIGLFIVSVLIAGGRV